MGLGAVVEQVLGIERVQPVQGERWPGAIAQPPLAPGAVGGRDAYRAVDGEVTAMFRIVASARGRVRRGSAKA